MRLAVERGFENVLVEDIAADVGVSARTFNNYFGSKAEAVTSRHLTGPRYGGGVTLAAAGRAALGRHHVRGGGSLWGH